ncbi:hypothetical protein [Variovorax sp. KK3]|uniref:hypothetical protein n=1 Tax=Variovorax sp. KK3 TaxID=1855728 RepID=UPI0011811599|nr:hypothetical protein [Variovorax sp. KK3]
MKNGYQPNRPSRMVNDAMRPVTHCVARLCDLMVRLPDDGDRKHRARLEKAHENARMIHRILIQIADSIGNLNRGAITSAQTYLHRLQRLFRNNQALMVGVPDRFLDHPQPTLDESIRRALQASIDFYRLDVLRTIQGAATDAFDAIPPAVYVAREACHAHAETVSMLFERSEQLHRALIDRLCRLSEVDDPKGQVRSAFGRTEAHLLKQHFNLNRLLEAAGHQQTSSIRLARNIYDALGHAEGAMIGKEGHYERTCQPFMDLVGARANELSHYNRPV